MVRLLTASIALALICACGDDARRPAEVARVEPPLVPVEDTLGPEAAPVTESPPAAPTQPERRPRPAIRTPPTSPKDTVRPAPAPSRDTVAAPPPGHGAEPEADAVAGTDSATSVDLVDGRPPPADPVTDSPEPVDSAADGLAPVDSVADSIAPVDSAADSLTSEAVVVDSTGETVDTAPTPVPSPARSPDTVGTRRPIPPPLPPPALPETSPGASSTIPVGAELHAALIDSIHSRRDSAGTQVTARLMENFSAPDGRTLLPAGSVVRLTVVRLAPAGSRNAADGQLELEVEDIALNGEQVEVAADVRPIPHELRGRGVTGSEAAKVGAGAAAGAIAGRVLGGNTRGAVIGGVVGAAGGAAVAAQTADRDVVVKSGTPITFVLTAPLVAPAP